MDHQAHDHHNMGVFPCILLKIDNRASVESGFLHRQQAQHRSGNDGRSGAYSGAPCFPSPSVCWALCGLAGAQ